MGALEQLVGIELAIIDLLVPLFGIFVALSFGKMMLLVVDNFVAGMLLRIRGYHVHLTVKIDGEIATITRIGWLSTHFQIINGSDNRIEYLAVSNTRLDFRDVRRLIRKFDDDPMGGK